MEFEGQIWKEGTWWLAEVPFLDLMTQGKTKKDVLNMIADAAFELVKDSYEKLFPDNFEVTTTLYDDGIIGLGASDDTFLFALGLKRQRELSGTTIREAAKRLKSKSPNAYARYEAAKAKPSIEKYNQLLHAANPERRPLLVS